MFSPIKEVKKMLRCPNCNEKVARFPLKDSNGKLIVKNLFKMDLMSVLIFIVIILVVVSYKIDTETCMEIIEDPLTYCEESNACKIIEERKGIDPYRTVDISKIPEINFSGI